MKKLLHIITGLNTGGAERALYNLLQGGMADRFDCHVVSLMDEGTMGAQIKALGVPVTTLEIKRGIPSFSVLRKLRQLIQEQQPDVIQGWMYHGNLVAWLARLFSRNNPELVWNIRQSLYTIADEKLLTRQVIRANRFFSFGVDVLLYNSHLSRKQHKKFGFSAAKSKVIPNGIDVRNYNPSNDARVKIRLELSIPEDALVVGHVARLHPMKDHPLFLKAAIKLADRFSNLHFILCGRNVLYSSMEIGSLVPAKLHPRFHLLGEREDIPELMCAMDILSSSSWGEAFPNVLGEAMACGVPCVATDVGDSAVIVSDYGVVVSPHDEAALADGMEKLLLMPVEERRTLGIQARKHIVDNFALESIVGQYCGLYEKLLQDRRDI